MQIICKETHRERAYPSENNLIHNREIKLLYFNATKHNISSITILENVAKYTYDTIYGEGSCCSAWRHGRCVVSLTRISPPSNNESSPLGKKKTNTVLYIVQNNIETCFHNDQKQPNPNLSVASFTLCVVVIWVAHNKRAASYRQLALTLAPLAGSVREEVTEWHRQQLALPLSVVDSVCHQQPPFGLGRGGISR